MSEVIKIENLSKVYKRKTKRDGKNVIEDFWALRDLSLSINQGEVLGIIGKNGAGKSTLLKILSKITSPTSGKVTINGRVGSLLEVGTGFHPEMTGRENIYMNGNILGMSNAEINRKLDEIVDFSGVSDFLETPVKRYSSGMQTRLAFAVAAHLEPEILIIDEVLAVGDAEFQKKCLNKIDEIRQNRRTILFVSHRLDAIRNLCTRCAWLHNGELKLDNTNCNQVIKTYLSHTISSHTLKHFWHPNKNLTAKTESPVEVLKFCLTDCNGELVDGIVLSDEALKIHVHFNCKTPQKNLCIGYYLFNTQNQLIYMSLSTDSKAQNNHNYDAVRHNLSCNMPTNILGDGEYYLKLTVGITNEKAYYSHENSDIGIVMRVNGNQMRSSLWKNWSTQQIYPVLPWVHEQIND